MFKTKVFSDLVQKEIIDAQVPFADVWKEFSISLLETIAKNPNEIRSAISLDTMQDRVNSIRMLNNFFDECGFCTNGDFSEPLSKLLETQTPRQHFENVAYLAVDAIEMMTAHTVKIGLLPYVLRETMQLLQKLESLTGHLPERFEIINCDQPVNS